MTRLFGPISLLMPLWTLPAALPFLVVVCLMPVQRAFAQATYEDGDFDVDGDGVLIDWSIYGPFVDADNATGADVDALAPRSGGNPGAFLRSQLTSVSVPAGGWVVWGFLINEAAEYDPGSGAIERVDFDLDAKLPSGARGSRAVSLAVRQDEFLWAAVGPRIFIEGQNWTSWSIPDLQPSDFIALSLWREPDQPQMPDFSEDGMPVYFGLLQGQSCPETSDCSAPPAAVEVDIDNWIVKVNGGDGGTSGGGGTGGVGGGGTGGVGGYGSPQSEGGGCACRIGATTGSNPWFFPFLCLTALAILRRFKRR
jgi:hypothetical protein